MKERREHPRKQVQIGVVHQVTGSDKAHEGVITDVSMGGAFVESGAVPPFGAQLSLRARLPDQQVDLTLPGVVRWVKAGGFGVQFGLLGARETHALTQLLQKRG